MGNVTSPKSPADLADWLMVQSHGKTYLGRPVDGRVEPDPGNFIDLTNRSVADIARYLSTSHLREVVLDPVFEYVTAMTPMPQQTPAGVQVQMVPSTSLRTCFGLFSTTRLRVVSYGTAVRFGDLDRDEQSVLAQMITDTLEALQRARAERAGITVAPAGSLDALKRAMAGKGGPR